MNILQRVWVWLTSPFRREHSMFDEGFWFVENDDGEYEPFSGGERFMDLEPMTKEAVESGSWVERLDRDEISS